MTLSHADAPLISIVAHAGYRGPAPFRPYLLAWPDRPACAELVDRLQEAAARAEPPGLLVPCTADRQLVLVPLAPLTPTPADRPPPALRSVRAALREAGVEDCVRVAVGEAARLGERLDSVLARFPGPAPQDALGRLALILDKRRAAAFVGGQLGPLLAHDRLHGTDLAGVLELALDRPTQGDAARAAYMHRNTFRKHLRRALELVAADLGRPEERLALHLALKLRHRPGDYMQVAQSCLTGARERT